MSLNRDTCRRNIATLPAPHQDCVGLVVKHKQLRLSLSVKIVGGALPSTDSDLSHVYFPFVSQPRARSRLHNPSPSQ